MSSLSTLASSSCAFPGAGSQGGLFKTHSDYYHEGRLDRHRAMLAAYLVGIIRSDIHCVLTFIELRYLPTNTKQFDSFEDNFFA